MRIKCWLLKWLLLFISANLFAQSKFNDSSITFANPKIYKAIKATHSIKIDGKLLEDTWNKANWSEAFIDITGDSLQAPSLTTSFKMVWDEANIYIAAQLEEPHIWASLQKRDTILYHDNVFEIFIDPNGDGLHYTEIEVNAFNTLFDLMLDKPYNNGGKSNINWDLEGLEVGIHHHGTLNNGNDIDTGWTIEMKIPIASLPYQGDPLSINQKNDWRINFCRAQWPVMFSNGAYQKNKDKNGRPIPKSNSVWSSQNGNSMHSPERWGYVYFVVDSVEKMPIEKLLKFAISHILWVSLLEQKD